MPLPYIQNKVHIYKWRETHKDIHNTQRVRCYYKKKIECPFWRQIKYEFLDILLD